MTNNDKKKSAPTKEQEAAIIAGINQPTVVSASAGTGKTTMLVERVIRLLSDYENPVYADKVAILTFTVNATKHLRDKLSAALSEKMETAEDTNEREFLAEQSIKLRKAPISTINAFCLGVIKDNIEKFNLPVNISILDDAKAMSLKLNAVTLAKLDFYNDEIFSEDERKLLFYTFSFRDDKDLFDKVEFTHYKLSSYSDFDKWLDDAVGLYDSVDTLEKFYIPVYAEYMNNLREISANCRDYLTQLMNEYGDYCSGLPETKRKEIADKQKKLAVKDSMAEFIGKISELENKIDEFVKAPSLDALEKLSLYAQMQGKPDISKDDNKNEIKKRFTPAKKFFLKILDEIASIGISKSEEEHNLEHNRIVVSTFAKLVRTYKKYFDELKHSQGYVDFADCEILLLDKLRNDDDFREFISSRYSCVIVDEFQDCNDVQAEIFRLIGKNCQFYVGDIKQSIYAFRGGNPQIMAELCKGKYGFNPLPLTMNFRSRKQVIDTVNDAFSGLMTEKYGGTEYTDAKLVCGMEYPDADNSIYNTEIYSVDTKTMTQEKFVAEKIYELMHDENFKITKNGELCRPNYSDFAILLRKNKRTNDYRRALAELNISSVVPKGKNIFESEEIAVLVNYLKVIDNPLNDKELLNVLMSPLYRFTADDTTKIRLGILGYPDDIADKTADISAGLKHYGLYECLKFCALGYGNRGNYSKSEAKQKAEACEKALADEGIKRDIDKRAVGVIRDIENFRRFMGNNPIADLIQKVCADTDIYAVVCALDDSKRRISNLRRFEKAAEDFSARDGGTLSDFLRFIKQAEEIGKNAIEEMSIPDDTVNSVRIMTFHASKGLEVPICILAELQTDINPNDYKGNFLLNHDYYYSMAFVDHNARYQASTFAHSALKFINKERPKGEELRLLYVAMTRAQEKLIMVEEYDEDENYGGLYEGGVPFKWVLRNLNTKGYEEKTAGHCINGGQNGEMQAEYDENDDVNQGEFNLDVLKELVGKKYRNENETVMRAKYSVTELAHRNEEMPFVLTKPSFAVKSQIKGTDIGNAYHHTMEHIPLDKLKKADDLASAVSSAIDDISKSWKITEQEKQFVKPEKIVNFLTSDLGKRMLNSNNVQRECSFYAEISGKDISLSEIGDNTAIQGQIDMFFEEEDGIVIVDYKSDTEKNLEKEKDNYSLQVKIYAKVAPKLFGKPVKEMYLYSFSSNKAIEISNEEAKI